MAKPKKSDAQNLKSKQQRSQALATRDSKPPEASSWDDLDGMNDEQRAEAIAIKQRIGSRPQRPAVTLRSKGTNRNVVIGRESEVSKVLHSMRLYDVLGTGSPEYVDDFLRRLTDTVRLLGKNDDQDANTISAALALVAAIAPRDELEATMALQMIAANEAALMCFERSRRAEYLEHASAYSNMANKAMRSFALQVEAIAKLRRGGEQVVRHVHVNEGGQAVIAGTVNTGGGRNG